MGAGACKGRPAWGAGGGSLPPLSLPHLGCNAGTLAVLEMPAGHAHLVFLGKAQAEPGAVKHCAGGPTVQPDPNPFNPPTPSTPPTLLYRAPGGGGAAGARAAHLREVRQRDAGDGGHDQGGHPAQGHHQVRGVRGALGHVLACARRRCCHSAAGCAVTHQVAQVDACAGLPNELSARRPTCGAAGHAVTQRWLRCRARTCAARLQYPARPPLPHPPSPHSATKHTRAAGGTPPPAPQQKHKPNTAPAVPLLQGAVCQAAVPAGLRGAAEPAGRGEGQPARHLWGHRAGAAARGQAGLAGVRERGGGGGGSGVASPGGERERKAGGRGRTPLVAMGLGMGSTFIEACKLELRCSADLRQAAWLGRMRVWCNPRAGRGEPATHSQRTQPARPAPGTLQAPLPARAVGSAATFHPPLRRTWRGCAS